MLHWTPNQVQVGLISNTDNRYQQKSNGTQILSLDTQNSSSSKKKFFLLFFFHIYLFTTHSLSLSSLFVLSNFFYHLSLSLSLFCNLRHCVHLFIYLAILFFVFLSMNLFLSFWKTSWLSVCQIFCFLVSLYICPLIFLHVYLCLIQSHFLLPSLHIKSFQYPHSPRNLFAFHLPVTHSVLCLLRPSFCQFLFQELFTRVSSPLFYCNLLTNSFFNLPHLIP